MKKVPGTGEGRGLGSGAGAGRGDGAGTGLGNGDGCGAGKGDGNGEGLGEGKGNGAGLGGTLVHKTKDIFRFTEQAELNASVENAEVQPGLE